MTIKTNEEIGKEINIQIFTVAPCIVILYSVLFIQLMHFKMLKFTLTFTREVLLHVSVSHNHHQGSTVCALLKL